MALLAPVLVLLALGAPLVLLVASAVLMGIGLETFAIFWDTSLQQHIPAHALSRVSSYDALGSFVFIPVGQTAAGPVAAAIGLDAALWVAAAIVLAAVLGMVGTPDVRNLRRIDAQPEADPAIAAR